jgi:hypothetical protein
MAIIPSTNAIYDCMRLATTEEAAEFFHQRLTSQLQSAKVAEKSKALLDAIEKFAQYVEFKASNIGNIWGGDIDAIKMTDFEKWQGKLAKIASDVLANKSIKMDFAINKKDANIIRRYLEEIQEGELQGTWRDVEKGSETEMAMDAVFNAWLAKQKLISKSGVIYQCTENGEIAKDKAGNPIKANVEKLEATQKDPKDGFIAFAKNYNRTLTVSSEQHPFTVPEDTTTKKTTTKKTEEAPSNVGPQ